MSSTEAAHPAQAAFAANSPLEQGDHLDQRTFHKRCLATPKGVKAELIGGIVYMPSPAKLPHGRHTNTLAYWLAAYQLATPGVEALDNTSAILGEDSEPQFDAGLRILESHGGQSREDEHEWLIGAPELVVEVASSTAAYDLHSKRRDYERYGVQEYLVLIVQTQQAQWFVREGDRFVDLPANDDALFRSRMFAGLWLDAQAVFQRDLTRLSKALQQGLATPEHEQFVARLARQAGQGR